MGVFGNIFSNVFSTQQGVLIDYTDIEAILNTLTDTSDTVGGDLSFAQMDVHADSINGEII